MFENICKRIKIVYLQIKLSVCKDGLIDIVLDWNESLQEENKQLKEKVEGYERVRDRLVEIGFPTFMSCKEYAGQIAELKQQIEKMKSCYNCKNCVYAGVEIICRTYDCINNSKWEIKENENL